MVTAVLQFEQESMALLDRLDKEEAPDRAEGLLPQRQRPVLEEELAKYTTERHPHRRLPPLLEAPCFASWPFSPI